MNNKTIVLMCQVMPARWEITTQNGTVLKRDINVGTNTDAYEYARAYVSSFSDWTFELVPLKKASNPV